MPMAQVSSKGQITLPAAIRRKFGIVANSRVEVMVREDEIVIRPSKSIGDLYGVFHRYVEGREPLAWEEQRRVAAAAAAREALDG